MALKSREIAIKFLNKKKVLHDFAMLLLGYTSLNKSLSISPVIKELLFNHFSYDKNIGTL